MQVVPGRFSRISLVVWLRRYMAALSRKFVGHRGVTTLSRPLIPSKERIPTFAVGCGRSGTHFLVRVLSEAPSICAMHLDDIGHLVGDGFLHYCAWYGLPVDVGGFLKHRSDLIHRAGENGQQYFEANSYLALSIEELHQHFDARFIHLFRSPEKVVYSKFVKGWYANEVDSFQPHLIPGYSYDFPVSRPHRYFGHILPKSEDELNRWLGLTRVGKIAWHWNTLNRHIDQQLNKLPASQSTRIQLEKIDYQQYCGMLAQVAPGEPMNKEKFQAIQGARPGKTQAKFEMARWNSREKAEFMIETEEMRTLLKIDEFDLV